MTGDYRYTFGISLLRLQYNLESRDVNACNKYPSPLPFISIKMRIVRRFSIVQPHRSQQQPYQHSATITAEENLRHCLLKFSFYVPNDPVRLAIPRPFFIGNNFTELDTILAFPLPPLIIPSPSASMVTAILIEKIPSTDLFATTFNKVIWHYLIRSK
ncbi:hypothetical protein BCR42DRAFT_468138 [Absidia repens]|uniref:Uncharacterized protein n=1 Tax=Absidia repens TaxID=90262 RepID=A0A1X2IBA0_9FUNG|nr:hypothetical protein BCR42DRAFT_468138 [Absidia repens]